MAVSEMEKLLDQIRATPLLNIATCDDENELAVYIHEFVEPFETYALRAAELEHQTKSEHSSKDKELTKRVKKCANRISTAMLAAYAVFGEHWNTWDQQTLCHVLEAVECALESQGMISANDEVRPFGTTTRTADRAPDPSCQLAWGRGDASSQQPWIDPS